MSSDSKWTQRRLIIRLFNTLGSLLAKAGLQISLDETSLIRAAKRRTGVKNFSDDDFLPPMRKALAAIEDTARLTPFGRFMMRFRLVDSLSNRLRVDALLRQHPEILEQTIDELWVIAALPRTGTTLLQRLLSADPGTRTTLLWETLYPVPERKILGLDPRLLKPRLLEIMAHYISPNIFTVHPMEYDGPEEDAMILQCSFLTQAAEGSMWVPDYALWLEDQDKTPAYEFLKKVLLILQWQQPQQRWLIKNPFHLEDLDALKAVFPQAKIILTHRDMRKVLPSFCSMVANYTGFFSNTVEPENIRQHWLRKFTRLLERADTYRASVPGNANDFYDVSYAELVQDPIAEVKKIYARFACDLNDAAMTAIQQHSQINTQHKYGKHVYDQKDFGLTNAMIDEAFASYHQQYHIPKEG